MDGGSFEEYLWSNGATTATIMASMPDVYGLTITDENGCTDETSLEVTAFASPEPQISGLLAICQDSSASLSVQEFVSYLWSTDDTEQAIQVNMPGTYSVTVTDENGCQGSVATDVSENEAPTVQISGDLSFCEGNTTELSAGDFASYEWSDGSETARITVSEAGPYGVTITDDNGCAGVASVEVSTFSPPNVSIGGVSSICPGDSTELSAGNFETYLWSTNSEASTITVDAAGTYSVTVTDDNGCENTASVDVEALALPEVEIMGSSSLCPDETTTLEAGNFQAYLWSNGEETSSIVIDLPDTYSVTVTDENGCQNDASLEIVTAEAPTVEISGELAFCSGSTTQLETADFDTYLWSNGAETASIVVDQPGPYSVTVTNIEGCEGEAQVMVQENSLPDVLIEATKDYLMHVQQ